MGDNNPSFQTVLLGSVEEPQLEATHYVEVCVVSRRYRLPHVQGGREWWTMVRGLWQRPAIIAVSVAKRSSRVKARAAMESISCLLLVNANTQRCEESTKGKDGRGEFLSG